MPPLRGRLTTSKNKRRRWNHANWSCCRSDKLFNRNFLEQEGRLKYGLRKPGEELVVVTDAKTEQPASAESEDSAAGFDEAMADNQTSRVSNPQRWWYYFFNRAAYEELKNSYGG